MTPRVFVAGLLASVRETAGGTADYFAFPPVENPPDHLGRLTDWYGRLAQSDREIVRDVIRYAAERSLFVLLTHLDNLAAVTGEQGDLEVWHTATDGRRTRLNDPDGELLTDLFNECDGPSGEPGTGPLPSRSEFG